MKWLWLLLPTLLACTTFKTMGEDERMALTTKQVPQFEGSYKILSVDTAYLTLSNALLSDDYFNIYNKPDSCDRVEIKFIDANHLQVTTFDNDINIASKTLKGKIKGNYFVLKKKVEMPFFWLILNSYHTQRTRIGLLNNGHLTVNVSGGGCALLVVFPIMCAEGAHYQIEFARI